MGLAAHNVRRRRKQAGRIEPSKLSKTEEPKPTRKAKAEPSEA